MTITAPVITIDGPSGAGKGTLCKAMANALQWHILDSGAIYRVLALSVLHHQIDIKLELEEKLVTIAENLDVHFIFEDGEMMILLEGEDITDEIYVQTISNTASKIAVFSRVREALLRRQRAFLNLPGLIADGRDMGTVVFPNALVKIFLDARPEERAYRRMLQLQKKGLSVSFRHLLAEIKERDQRDCNRVVAPLIPANDAFMLDSTGMNIKQVVSTVLSYAHDKLALCNKLT